MSSQQNQNCFAVVVSPSGGLPTLVNQNSNEYWEFMNLSYEVLETGTKKHCTEYQEEMMAELVNIEYFN